MNGTPWGPIALLVALVLASALYSMSETAMMSLSRAKVRALAEKGESRAKWLEHLVMAPNRILGTVLFGNNLANIAASAVATALFIRLMGQSGVAWATAVMALAILIFAEIGPKTYAAHNPDRVALGLAPFLSLSARVFYPLVRLLTWFGVTFIRLLGGKTEGGRLLTEDEIRSMVEVGEEQGLIEENERQMIQGIFRLGETMVREVLVPRIDMDVISEDATLEEAWEAMIQFGHSRLPVYRQTVDDIVGVIYSRDVLAYLHDKDRKTPIRELVRSVLYVPETKKVDELLAEFRRLRTQIAIVLDEYGGTAGMVTIEDLLEEIVGEIQDEYDTEDVPIREVAEGVLDVDGACPLDDVSEYWEIEVPHENVDTVGGLILHLLGRAPVEGETVRLGDLEFTAAKVVGRRVRRALVQRRTLTTSGEPRGISDGAGSAGGA